MYYQIRRARRNFIASIILFAFFAVCSLFFPIGEGETPAEETQYYEELEAAATEKYIINTATKKIHLPSCEAAETISGYNKKYIIATKEYLVANGYIKCFSCNPY